MSQRRDFFLNSRPGSGVGVQVLPESFRWGSSFDDDPELVEKLVAAWRESGQFRAELVAEVRAAAWKVRNRRMCERWGFDDSLRLIFETAHLMLLAGLEEWEVVAFVGCHGHACVCQGCDLWDGARWTSGTRAVSFFSDVPEDPPRVI